VGNENMFRVMFNTAFIPDSNVLELSKMELSPEDIRKDKDKKIPRNFIVRLIFADFCGECNSVTTEIENLCIACKAALGEGTLN
jgi:hypothetical protein